MLEKLKEYIMKKNIYSVTVFIMAACIFGILLKILSYSFVFAEDTAACENIFTPYPPSGNYFASILTWLFTVILPQYLNIHPTDFKSHYFSIIESGILLFFLLFFLRVFFKNHSKNYLYPISFLFVTVVIAYTVEKNSYSIFLYSLFLKLTSGFLLFYIFYKLLNKNKEFTEPEMLVYTGFTYVCAYSNEFIGLTLAISLSLYLIYCLITKKPKANLVALFFMTAFSVWALTITAKAGIFSSTVSVNLLDTNVLLDSLKSFTTTFPIYIKTVFLKSYLGYILLFLQLFFLNTKFPKNETIIKTTSLILCFLAGLWIYFFVVIILAQNTNVIDSVNYILIYNILLCGFNFVLFNHVLNNNVFPEYRVAFVLFFISMILCSKNLCSYYSFMKNCIVPLRKNVYIYEKIIRLASLKNQTAVLYNKESDSNSFRSFLWIFFPTSYGQEPESNIIYSQENEYIHFLNKIKNNNIKVKLLFSDHKAVINSFSQMGGVIDPNELLSKNIRFTKLYDNNFVLNNISKEDNT